MERKTETFGALTVNLTDWSGKPYPFDEHSGSLRVQRLIMGPAEAHVRTVLAAELAVLQLDIEKAIEWLAAGEA
ncbi:MAG: hypothetical protein EBT13_13370 [Rhodobacteraceae bacterium]|nr:hypothetical protein [Paracoccaceae bacterium]